MGQWVWVFKTTATIRQGASKGTDDKLLKGQNISQLDGAVQNYGGGTCRGRGHTRLAPDGSQTPVVGAPVGHAWRRLPAARFGGARIGGMSGFVVYMVGRVGG